MLGRRSRAVCRMLGCAGWSLRCLTAHFGCGKSAVGNVLRNGYVSLDVLSEGVYTWRAYLVRG